MRWQDLDLALGVWMVPATWSKNRREMAIPLTNIAVAVLQRRQQGRTRSPWVWPSAEAKVGHVVNPEKPWRAFLEGGGHKRKGLPPRRTADARFEPCKIGGCRRRHQ